MVTIFTPTYNRKRLLQRLKYSLDKQTDQDFEWIIIDDGSTDHTEDIVRKWQTDANYLIRYFKQENSGKHIAFNRAVKMANGDIFVCVDSDDEVVPETIKYLKFGFLKLTSSDIGTVSPQIDRK